MWPLPNTANLVSAEVIVVLVSTLAPVLLPRISKAKSSVVSASVAISNLAAPSAWSTALIILTIVPTPVVEKVAVFNVELPVTLRVLATSVGYPKVI